jgi:hypothetical protein
MKYYPISFGDAAFRRHHHARATGEFRCPRKGEYFLSGAIIEVYQAHNDLTMEYYIAEIVKTKTITTIVEDFT